MNTSFTATRGNRAAIAGFVAVMTALGVVFYLRPEWHIAIWCVMCVLVAATVAGSVRVHRPRWPMWWVLIAGAYLIFAAANAVYHVLDAASARHPFPTPTDAFYLLIYPFLAAGLLGLAGFFGADRDQGSLLDVAAFSCGASLIAWLYIIDPRAEVSHLSVLQQCIAVGYSLGDMILLLSMIHLASATRYHVSGYALAASTAGLLISDVAYWSNQLDGQWQVSSPASLGWLVFLTGSGVAALHPSMAGLPQPRPVRTIEPSTRVVVLLTISSLIAPTVLFIESVQGRAVNGVVIALTSGVTFLLVLIRLAGVGNRLRQSLGRERVLREAGAALVAAADMDGVAGAVRVAVARLTPAGTTGPHGSLEVLASQAELAIDRIALSAEIARRSSEEYFRTLVQQAADVILIVDDDDRLVYASPSASALFAVEPDPGTPLVDLFSLDDRELILRSVQAMRQDSGRSVSTDWTVSDHRDGGPAQVEVSYRDLREDPSVSGLVITLRDVTEQRRLEGELTYLAFHDSLTGLPNRVLFEDRLGRAVARATRRGVLVGVLFIDLDDFKMINDTLGHAVGDEMLAAVGRRLAEQVRPQDVAARLGGDEFAVLIEDAKAPVDVERVADRISTALSEPFRIGDQILSGVGSIGVATTLETTDSEELRRQADLALYLAKSAGSGLWRRYQPRLHAEYLARMEMRSALDQAVSTGAFALRYQPIVELATGRPVGVEALVRWKHPSRGLVLPREFIEVAEETGLIVPIGDWVLAHALADAARWYAEDRTSGLQYVTVNISVRQFHSAGFIHRVLRELDLSGLPPCGLMLEITESLLLRDDEQVWADLARLRDHGIRVAIDDFGTGYSALSYLRQAPIDVLKIDRSFIDTIMTSGQQLALVEGIIRLARTLGLEVVAEGLEHPAQLDHLLRVDCRLGQGYLFAEPMSYREACGWLASRLGKPDQHDGEGDQPHPLMSSHGKRAQ